MDKIGLHNPVNLQGAILGLTADLSGEESMHFNRLMPIKNVNIVIVKK